MAGAASTYPGTLDGFTDGAYDPSIADAVNRMQATGQTYPPAVIANVTAQTVEDDSITTTLTLSTGVAQATLIGLVKGTVVTNINLNSGAPSAGQAHLWAAISTATSPTCLAVSADGGTAVTGGTTVQTIALASQWTVPSTGLYYLHVAAAATTTMPTFDAALATAGLRATQKPIIGGTWGSALTTPPVVGSTNTLSVTLTATKALAAYIN